MRKVNAHPLGRSLDHLDEIQERGSNASYGLRNSQKFAYIRTADETSNKGSECAISISAVKPHKNRSPSPKFDLTTVTRNQKMDLTSQAIGNNL